MSPPTGGIYIIAPIPPTGDGKRSQIGGILSLKWRDTHLKVAGKSARIDPGSSSDPLVSRWLGATATVRCET
jgi:hypothetical protein